MLENIYSSKTTIKLFRNGPLGSYPDELAEYYLAHSYATKSLKSRFGPLNKFNNLLIESNKCIQDIDRQLVEEFIDTQLKTKKSFLSSGASFLFEKFVALLVRDGILQPSQKRPEFGSAGVRKLLINYSLYLKNEKGLATSSIGRYYNLALDFSAHSNAATISKLTKINIDKIHTYIIERSKSYSTGHVQIITTCLRCFFKYLFRKGVIPADLAVCIPTVNSYRAAHLPEYLEHNQLKQLLESCNQRTANGVRNYSILLLLSRIGLRASEVIKINLQDINWRAGEFSIKGKGSKLAVMPLPNDVGEAISNYVINYRKNNNYPQVFLNTRAPFLPLSNPSTISSIVKRQLILAGIKTVSKGAHLLRYTVATNCLKNGGTLLEACELLRHFSIDTTAIYAKVDYNQLLKLAMPWPFQEADHE